jgi:hypothetical protein
VRGYLDLIACDSMGGAYSKACWKACCAPIRQLGGSSQEDVQRSIYEAVWRERNGSELTIMPQRKSCDGGIRKEQQKKGAKRA